MFQKNIQQVDVEFLLTHGKVIERYEQDFPLSSVLLNGRTLEGRPLHMVLGMNFAERKLVIITVYEPDPLTWTEDFSRRLS